MIINKVYCLFEQSGTFKKEFKKLGYEAFDYDIKNEFNQTDKIIDLFFEIEKAFIGQPSIFDNISKDDLIIAFYPCVRFEDQIQLHFRGEAIQMKNWSDEQKLTNDLLLHNSLHELYTRITQLVIVCLRRKIPLIIENPYSTQHYLVRYWGIKAKVIDKDRTTRGDYYKKPTQYWFINCEPQQNMILEAYTINERKVINNIHNTTERSLISNEYASRFIREFIIQGGKNDKN